jgi:hypothetical protein
MNVIDESEAWALLAKNTFCDLSGEWLPERVLANSLTIASGLVDVHGAGTMLQVKLSYRRGPRTGIVNYVFSVFRRTAYGALRVEELKMIWRRISAILGIACHPLSDDGLVAIVDSPFKFPDGDDIPIFIEKSGKQLRFFDDGGALLHLLGRGFSIDEHSETRFVRDLAEPHQVALNKIGELEIWSTEKEALAAFANYISTMLSLAKWESDQMGIATETTLTSERNICAD